MNLRNKVAVVTGAAQGMGQCIALDLSKAGASVVCVDIQEDRAEQVRRQIEKEGGKAIAIRADVSRSDDVRRMVEKTIEHFGKIDILVNNAGMQQKAPGGGRLNVVDIEESDWDRMMGVNLKGVFNCAKAVIPFMVTQRWGRIVNIASVAGVTGGGASASGAHYAVSKAGIICLTKVLARELGQYGINVNAIAPGQIITKMAETSAPAYLEAAVKRTPLGRLGVPADVAGVVRFLVSELAGFLTGETIIVDGGKILT